uniref:Thiol:disulfide interchange protein DsbD n=1 Tax=Candidatus Kentrum sp. DK TaxID=2126562 RepID=A0A450T7H1_9GAMM|nr:MAG: thiol:disulfide interchange protein DsbD [Candidatus Kentron sp. DK]
MEAMTLERVGLLSTWMLGVSVGLTLCSASCLPYMGSWILGRNQKTSAILADTGLFAFGRILAYATLGATAGGLGEALLRHLQSGVGNILMGAASILAGLWLIGARQRSGHACGPGGRSHLPPLLLGYSLGFVPCPPLAALLTISALAGGGIGMGMAYGIAFGLGAALTPLFVILPLLGGLGRALRSGRPWLGSWMTWLAGSILVVIGAYRLSLAL